MSTEVCQACHSAELETPKDNHQSYLVCPSCHAIQLTYQPLPHQEEFHRDPAKYRMFAGGYGSGKTRTTVQEALLLGLENPGVQAVMTAATLPQLRETSYKMFNDIVPPPLIKEHKSMENKTILINGTEYLWRPADEEGKLRSLNLGFFHIEEASEVKHEIFVQLQSRLRSDRMKFHRGLLSTNPDLNWIKTEFLLHSATIFGSPDDYSLHMLDRNPNFSTHIVQSELNTYLPPDFIADLMRNKPEWWIKRYLKGSFAHTEGAVYPNFSKTVIAPFPIPKHWNHYRVALDPGLRNPTAVLFAAVNPFRTASDFNLPKVVIYDEHYEAGKLVPYHAKIVREKVAKIPYGALQAMRIDPAARNRDPITGKSVQAYYQEHGLFFLPGNNSLDYGLSKVNTYIETDSLKIFNTCVNTIAEGLNYKYPEQELVDDKNPDEKPRKFKDHAMDALRYIIVDLPDDPNDLFNASFDPTPDHQSKIVRTVTTEGELITTKIPHALEDDDGYGDDWTSYT